MNGKVTEVWTTREHFAPQRLLCKAERRKSTWSDSLPMFLAKEHKTSKNKKEASKNKKEPSNLVDPFRRDEFMGRMKERLHLCSHHLKQRRAGSTTFRAQTTRTTRKLSYIRHAACKVWVYFVFFPRSCSCKGERTEGLENSGSERTRFNVS